VIELGVCYSFGRPEHDGSLLKCLCLCVCNQGMTVARKGGGELSPGSDAQRRLGPFSSDNRPTVTTVLLVLLRLDAPDARGGVLLDPSHAA